MQFLDSSTGVKDSVWQFPNPQNVPSFSHKNVERVISWSVKSHYYYLFFQTWHSQFDGLFSSRIWTINIKKVIHAPTRLLDVWQNSSTAFFLSISKTYWVTLQKNCQPLLKQLVLASKTRNKSRWRFAPRRLISKCLVTRINKPHAHCFHLISPL